MLSPLEIRYRDLIHRMQQNDIQAFGELYELIIDDVYRFVYFKIQHQETTEDITEEIFLKIWEKRNFYTPQSQPFLSWVFTLAGRMIIDHIRTTKPTYELEDIHLDEQFSPEKSTNSMLNSEYLMFGLNQLSEEEKDGIIYKYINELSYEEIAHITGKSEGALRTMISRAMVKLKAHLEHR